MEDLIHGKYVCYGLALVNFRNGVADSRNNFSGIAIDSYCYGHAVRRIVLYQRSIDQRSDFAGQTTVVYVHDYPNHCNPGDMVARRNLTWLDKIFWGIESDDFPNWILIWPEAARKRLVHNGYRRAVLRVLLAEQSSIQQRNV